jgi:hypothetical protein
MMLEHAHECSPEDFKAIMQELFVIRWELIIFVSFIVL